MARNYLDEWEDDGILEENLEIMRNLAYQGATLDIIGNALGVSRRWLEIWRKKDDRVRKALLRGREALVAETGRLLMEWVHDDNVSMSLRVAIAQDLNKRHGKIVLNMDNKEDEPETGSSSNQRVFVFKVDEDNV